MSERAAGRIVLVWTETVGTTLAADAAAAATTLVVDDASVFNDDGEGGWLIVGAEFTDGEYVTGTGQVIAYTDVDDDTGTVTLTDPLTDAADEDDDIHVWSDLYDEPDTRQWASVDPEGKGDRADYIDAIVDDGLELVDGDRGKRGEACTLFRERGSDTWEVRGPIGRPKRARGMQAEADDTYILDVADAGSTVTIPLSQVPIVESVKAFVGGVFQRPARYVVDYDTAAVSWDIPVDAPAGLRLAFHYWFVRGSQRARMSGVIVPFEAAGWRHLQVAMGDATDRSSSGFDDSGWPVAAAPFGGGAGESGGGFPASVSAWTTQTDLWLRRTVVAAAGQELTVSTRTEAAKVYWNGELVEQVGNPAVDSPIAERVTIVPAGLVLPSNVLAVRLQDDVVTAGPGVYGDVQVAYS